MRDDVYVGNLVSEDEIRHSSGPWKKHGYVKKTQENGYVRYWYPENLKGKKKEYIQNGASEEELQAAEDEYTAAEAAYRKDPSPENRKRLDEAEEEVSRARAIKRRDGKYEEKNTKEELKKSAKQKGKELLSSLDPRGRANDSVGTRSMPSNTEAEDRKKKRKSLSLFNHGVRHTGSKKKESKSDEVLKLEPTGNISNSAPTRQNRVGEKYQYYNGAFLSSGAKRESYTSIGNKKPISRPKNLIGSRASKDAMDDFLQDHPNVHKTQGTNKVDANLSTSIDASPVKDKKLRKQKAGRR